MRIFRNGQEIPVSSVDRDFCICCDSRGYTVVPARRDDPDRHVEDGCSVKQIPCRSCGVARS